MSDGQAARPGSVLLRLRYLAFLLAVSAAGLEVLLAVFLPQTIRYPAFVPSREFGHAYPPGTVIRVERRGRFEIAMTINEKGYRGPYLEPALAAGRFTVVALGTANPINTTTTDGVATSVITPLSNASAGVTVIVTAGDVQNSIRVDCALPLDTQPTLAPPTTGPITPPDTGNGGYLAQDGSSFPMWTLIALALGALAMVGTGVVARNAAK